jgi:hypothetical protein
MSDLPLFSPGDPRPRSAGVLNEMVNAARKARQTDLRTPSPSDIPYGPQDTIRVYNDTGTDIEVRYAIVGLKVPVFLPDVDAAAEHTFRETTCFEIEYPCTEDYAGRFAILQEPLKDGRIGTAILSGKFISLVDSTVSASDAVDVSASRSDDNSLSTVSGGVAKCLWVGDGTDLPADTKWGLMRFGGGGGGGGSLIHFTISDVSCDDIDDHGHLYATANVTFISCGASSPTVGEEIEVYDLMGCWLDSSDLLLAGRKGVAMKVAHDTTYESCVWSIIALCASDTVCS